MYWETNLSLLSCSLTSDAGTRTLSDETTFVGYELFYVDILAGDVFLIEIEIEIFYLECGVKAVRPFCQWMGHFCEQFEFFLSSSYSSFFFFFSACPVSGGTKRNRCPCNIATNTYQWILLTGPGGDF